MARTSYVPYDEAYDALFAFCDITPPALYDFGGNRGWNYDEFSEARAAAQNYLIDHDNDPGFDATWIELLSSDPNPIYWSTEGILVG